VARAIPGTVYLYIDVPEWRDKLSELSPEFYKDLAAPERK